MFIFRTYLQLCLCCCNNHKNSPSFDKDSGAVFNAELEIRNAELLYNAEKNERKKNFQRVLIAHKKMSFAIHYTIILYASGITSITVFVWLPPSSPSVVHLIGSLEVKVTFRVVNFTMFGQSRS